MKKILQKYLLLILLIVGTQATASTVTLENENTNSSVISKTDLNKYKGIDISIKSISQDWRFCVIITSLLLLLVIIVIWNRTLQYQIKLRIKAEKELQIDITEMKKQAQLIEQQKEEFEAIFNHSKDGIVILDLELNFLDFNDAYLQMTQYSREELLTKSCIDLTTLEDIPKIKAIIEQVKKDGFVENFEKSCLVKNGQIITINMSFSLMPDKQRIITVTKNITQNKLIESQAKLASMGEMIGNIAHQWRQPLSLISTLASSIAFKKEFGNLEEQEIVPNMEYIVSQANYLSKTIDNFRNFIKGENRETLINISELFEKTLSIVNPSLKNSYIELISDIDSTLEIYGYENELIQAFINIINNSKDILVTNENIENKYIFIEAKQIDNQCTITIKDNGGGIMISVINKIFEPYFTTKHQSQGTGLGLSMTHKIITAMHQSSISASNITYEYNGKEYTGASFEIILQR